MIEMIKKPLGGEAKTGSIVSIDGNGQLINPGLAICPIVKQFPNKQWRLIGTGFFISINGIFATAKHVIMDIFDKYGTQRDALAIIQFLPNNVCILRRVLRCTVNNEADTSIGVMAPMKNKKTGEDLKTKACTLTTLLPNIGDRVGTYAYPNHVVLDSSPQHQEMHLFPDFYTGRIEEYYPKGRDRTLLPSPCFRTSITIHGGASGGPVFDAHGKVFGINSTGFTGLNGMSFVSRVADIFMLKVTDVNVPGQNKNTFTIAELANLGHIPFSPPLKNEALAALREVDLGTQEEVKSGR